MGINYIHVREKVQLVINTSGPVTGLFHEYELKLANIISKNMPAVEMFRMLGSGTESVMGAAYMASGVVTLAGSRMYTSLADTDVIIDETLNRFEHVLSSVEGL